MFKSKSVFAENKSNSGCKAICSSNTWSRFPLRERQLPNSSLGSCHKFTKSFLKQPLTPVQWHMGYRSIFCTNWYYWVPWQKGIRAHMAFLHVNGLQRAQAILWCCNQQQCIAPIIPALKKQRKCVCPKACGGMNELVNTYMIPADIQIRR